MLLNQSWAVSSVEEKNTAGDTHFITAVIVLCAWEWVRTGDKARLWLQVLQFCQEHTELVKPVVWHVLYMHGW